MSEGDAIARLGLRISGRLAGLTLRRCRLPVGDRLVGDRLVGDRLGEVATVGKHLLLRFERGVTVHLHPRQDGRLRLVTWSTSRIEAEPQVLLDFGERGLCGWHLGAVDVVTTADERRVVGHLGPDLCDPSWGDRHTALALRRLAGDPRTPLVEALLDQRNLAGIGNLYAVEGCFIAGLQPWTPVGAVPDLGRVVDLEHRLLSHGLRTGLMVTTGDRRRGHDHWVYGRYRRPCRRCGTAIRFVPGDGGAVRRPTWWCPACQPERAGVDRP